MCHECARSVPDIRVRSPQHTEESAPLYTDRRYSMRRMRPSTFSRDSIRETAYVLRNIYVPPGIEYWDRGRCGATIVFGFLWVDFAPRDPPDIVMVTLSKRGKAMIFHSTDVSKSNGETIGAARHCEISYLASWESWLWQSRGIVKNTLKVIEDQIFQIKDNIWKKMPSICSSHDLLLKNALFMIYGNRSVMNHTYCYLITNLVDK